MQTRATMALSSISVPLSVSIGRLDQLRAVVDRHDLGALRQARRDLGEARLDALDHVERIGPEALQNDAARDLALAVQFGEAAPLVRTELDPRDVPHPKGRAVVGFQHDVLDVAMLFR